MKYFKTISAVLILSAVLALSGCVKPDHPKDPKCKETPPKGQVCAAIFTGWFYDSDTKTCKQISYSGCEQKGFESKEACNKCGCGDNEPTTLAP